MHDLKLSITATRSERAYITRMTKIAERAVLETRKSLREMLHPQFEGVYGVEDAQDFASNIASDVEEVSERFLTAAFAANARVVRRKRKK